MTRWLKRLRGAVGMGLTWAVAWAVFGVMIGVSSLLLPFLPWEAFFRVFDAPLPTLAVPGFVGGTLFSLVLGVAGRQRRFDELSLPQFTAWGATGGVLLGLVPLLAAGGEPVSWSLHASIVGVASLLSAGSAASTLLIARRAQARERITSGHPDDALAPSTGDAPRLESRDDRRA